MDWNSELLDQLEWHWDHQLRPRLQGMSDAEYFWEPVPGCWSIRPKGTSTAPISVGAGEYAMDFALPQPDPPPVTTIAWRLAHVIIAVFAARNASHFGGPPADYQTWEYASTAADSLRQLDEQHAAWIKGVRSLGATGLAHPVGQAEGPFAESPMATLVLHIHREVIHHGAEISLLRDLYRAKGDQNGL
ncbi:MAG: DinB family protein [Actinobacteria bacterium]|nr:DinB family protein [Actinomycetota bacterium]MBO0838821.1 DinB family protein [Actinomycetota bacterium]